MALIISYAKESDQTVPALLAQEHFVVGVVDSLNLLVVPYLNATWSSFIYRDRVDLLVDVFRMYEQLIASATSANALDGQFAIVNEQAPIGKPTMQIDGVRATMSQQADFERVVAAVQPNLMSVPIEAARITARRL